MEHLNGSDPTEAVKEILCEYPLAAGGPGALLSLRPPHSSLGLQGHIISSSSLSSPLPV